MNVLLLGVEGGGQPIQSFVETIPSCGTCCLDVPFAGAERMEAQLVRDLTNAHGVRHVLLVGKHEKSCVLKLVLSQHLLELFARFSDSVLVI